MWSFWSSITVCHVLVRGMGRKSEMSVRTALGAMRAKFRQLLTKSVFLRAQCVLAFLEKMFRFMRPSMEGGFALRPALVAAQAEPADARGPVRRWSGGGTGGVVGGAAGGRRIVFAKPKQTSEYGVESANQEPLHHPHQSAGGGLHADAGRGALPHHGRAVPCGARCDESGHLVVHPMEDNNNGWGVQVQGQPFSNVGASCVKANAEYFDSVGTHVVIGRGIGVQDTSASRPVAVVNQNSVKDLFKRERTRLGTTLDPRGRIQPVTSRSSA